MRRLAILLLLALAVPLAGASPAQAEFGFAPGSVAFRLVDKDGKPENRAGVHPGALEIDFAFNTKEEKPDGVAKSLVVDLPPGLLGTATATPACPRKVFDSKRLFGGEECPGKTRVGTLRMNILETGDFNLPLYNIEPAPGEFATFATNALGKTLMHVHLRPGDLGVTIETEGLLQSFPVLDGKIELWGVPADRQLETSIPRRPLLSTPTRCDGPLHFSLRANSWERPNAWAYAEAEGTSALEGCGSLPFDPATAVRFETSVTDSPSGATIDVTVPQDEGPDGLVSAEIRNLTLKLPEGVSLSAPGANGLAACSDAQIAVDSKVAAACPGASRVGSVEMVSPLLTEPLAGEIFVGEESGSERFRIFIVASSPGIEAKFAGSMEVDPKTGRIAAHLKDLPQIPLSRISLGFDGGPYALLATPGRCGSAPVEASLDNFARAGTTGVSAMASFSAGSRSCGALPFQPTFLAGSSAPLAGRFAGFSTLVERRDGEQPLGQLTMAFPPGLTAVLQAVSECPAAQAAAGSCPASSRIGSSTVELGPGPNPVPLAGDTYLTGPFRGDPYGMALVFHGRVGPFDIGAVVVRAGLEIDPRTGGLTVETEKLPQLKEGIPLRFRAMQINIDRPAFMRNPTSCTPKQVAATMRSTTGTAATAASQFEVRSCQALKFGPRVAMSAVEGPAKAPKKPSLRVRLDRLGRGANLRGMQMLLPHAFGFDFAGLRELCSHRQALAERCPRDAAVGTASARSSLVAQPLKGTIFVAQPQGDGLPEFLIDLRGAGLRFAMKAKTTLEDGEMQTHIERIPDVPLKRLSLRFAGGKSGILSSPKPLCRMPAMQGRFDLEAQSYALRVLRPAVAVGGCGVK